MSHRCSTAANRALTLGVIGHVDHGKTALVRALTGIETDRLAEERERGLSIVLGFAFLETPRGVVDLIDVPGHEAFIRAMIAGATALDGIVLCVAANEGMMPQTIEHFQIARLLGIERGFIVITKTDLVDGAELAVRRNELERRVRDTFLEGAPVVEVSVPAGRGLAAVREAAAALAALPIQRETRGPFFLPLDRVFTVHGFGLVVTGTLRGGGLRVGDAVEIAPAGKSSSVRALQCHGRPVERAVPGQRVAVNLRHLSRDEVARGDVLAAPGSVVAARRIDVELRVLEDAEHGISNGASVHVLTGATEALARVRLLDRQVLEPGGVAFAQLNLDRAIATRPSERLLLRCASPLRTIGGGRIIDVDTRRHRRFDARISQQLEAAASGDVERIVRQRLEEAGGVGVYLPALADELDAERATIAAIVARAGAAYVTEDLMVASSAFEELLTGAVAALERFHRKQPLKKGLDAGSLANAVESKTSPAVWQCVLRRLIEQKKIQPIGEVFCIAGYDPFAELGERQRQLARDIERVFLDGGLEPPSPDVVAGSDKARQLILGLLLETGRLVTLRTYDRGARIVLHADILEDARRTIAREFPSPAQFAVKDVRDLLGSTRRHVVPLLEHLDAVGATVRTGDLRRLRER
jgi:selenocysteine-specific elongation factor